MMTIRDYPVAVIGGGPVGMAAAAHLVERKIPFILFESGQTVGANLRDWGHVRVFSPWRYNIDRSSEKLLSEINWVKPDEDELPTGNELVEKYLIPLSFHPAIEPYLHLSARVVSITRKSMHKMTTPNRANVPFVIKVNEEGSLKSYEASAVIDATGTWQNPNPIGQGGVMATGEPENSDRITYRIPDIRGKEKFRYAGKNVLVAGSGHSAINSLLDLATLKKEYPETSLHWVLQKDDLAGIYGGQEGDALEARGALGIKIEKLVNSKQLNIYAPFHIEEISKKNGALDIKGSKSDESYEIRQIDEIIANTGARPDLSINREVRVQTDPSLESVPELAELIDPNIHSCGTVRPHGEKELRQPEPNFYIVGVKSYGRAPTFLMATGYEQVRSIVAWLDGDIESARRVELDLPETGVCSIDNGSAGCCTASTSTQQTTKPDSLCCSEPANSFVNDDKGKEQAHVIHESDESACCGGKPTSNKDACCKLDEEKKAEGLSGCGCGSEPASEGKLVKTSACC